MQRLGGFIDFVPVDSVTRPSQDFREFVVTHSAESSRTIPTTETHSFIVSLRIPAQSPFSKGLTVATNSSALARDREGVVSRFLTATLHEQDNVRRPSTRLGCCTP